jgi:Ni/Co efflux regulator RcnB
VAQGPPPGHGNPHDDHRNGKDHGNDRGRDFRFRDEDRGRLASHYHGDVQRWSGRSQGRPHFERGQRIPSNYRFRAVPRSYYRDMPPPPPGYQYGYYDGYVVAYSPTTRIIADVLDLVGAAASR